MSVVQAQMTPVARMDLGLIGVSLVLLFIYFAFILKQWQKAATPYIWTFIFCCFAAHLCMPIKRSPETVVILCSICIAAECFMIWLATQDISNMSLTTSTGVYSLLMLTIITGAVILSKVPSTTTDPPMAGLYRIGIFNCTAIIACIAVLVVIYVAVSAK